MQYFLSVVFSIIASVSLQAQTGNTVYGQLDTIKVLALNCFHSEGAGATRYLVNGREVDSLEHAECLKNYQLIKSCQPCWLNTYDEEGRLLIQMVAYGDCGVGAYREYYPSGQLKVKGHFQETWAKDDHGKARVTACSARHGSWTYYHQDGSFWYDETWRNDRFIEQVPNQGRSEIWAVDLTFFGGYFDPQQDLLRIDLINKLTITPRYKNANHAAAVTGELEILLAGEAPITATFTPRSFPSLDLLALLSGKDNWRQKDARISLKFYVNGEFFKHVPLNFY